MFWQSVGASIFSFKNPLSPTQFKCYFKLSINLVEMVFAKLREKFPNSGAKHLLWTFHFLKSFNPNHKEIATNLRISYKTLILYVRKTLTNLNKALPQV